MHPHFGHGVNYPDTQGMNAAQRTSADRQYWSAVADAQIAYREACRNDWTYPYKFTWTKLRESPWRGPWHHRLLFFCAIHHTDFIGMVIVAGFIVTYLAVFIAPFALLYRGMVGAGVFFLVLNAVSIYVVVSVLRSRRE